MPKRSSSFSSEMMSKSIGRKAASVNRTLTRVYGRKAADGEEDPLDTLVETILSQNTTDTNSYKSYQALKKAYPRWELMMDERPSKIADIIRSGGLADVKAERILGALEYIKHAVGKLDLGFLREMSPQDADAWLSRIKGVGPKTRSIVLLFSLKMPAFPVDTHVHRVTRRLGLIDKKASRGKAQADLAELVPAREFYNFHINLIEHGRSVCKARRPKCDLCKLSRLCDYFKETVRAS